MSRGVATVFGWAEAEQGTALYSEGLQLGRVLAAAGYSVRCGGYFGLMEAVARGVRDEGGVCTGICLDTFVGKPSNEYVTTVERCADLFDRLRALIVGSDILVAQPGSLGTVAEVAVAWCLRYLGHPRVGVLHLVGDGWTDYRSSMNSLKVAPVDADRVTLHPNVNAFAAALPHRASAGAGPRLDTLSFEEALVRLDHGIAAAGGLTDHLVRTLGAKDAAEFGNLATGGLELQQRPEEVVPLLQLLVDRHSGAGQVRYLEVGLGHGGTAILMARLLVALGVEARLTGVDDLSYERDGWLRGQRDRLRWCERELPLRLIEGTLRDQRVRKAVCADTYDVAFVDADHSFRGCLFDALAVMACLAPGGTLVLHDINDPDSPGVARVVRLLEPHFARTDRFIGGGRCGIAALHRPLPSLDILDLVAEAL